jgi:hypothetical protein
VGKIVNAPASLRTPPLLAERINEGMPKAGCTLRDPLRRRALVNGTARAFPPSRRRSLSPVNTSRNTCTRTNPHQRTSISRCSLHQRRKSGVLRFAPPPKRGDLRCAPRCTERVGSEGNAAFRPTKGKHWSGCKLDADVHHPTAMLYSPHMAEKQTLTPARRGYRVAACRLRFTLALLHEAGLCGAGKWLTVFSDRIRLARILCALRHEALECGAGERLAVCLGIRPR